MSEQIIALPELGQRASRTRVIGEEDVRVFAQLSDDHNPVHLDADYAATTPFGRPIAHGMLTATLISAILGNDLPGSGAVYLGQTLSFRAPVFIGDTITATVAVTNVRADKRIVTLRTDCHNQDGALILTGEAVVKY
jgi:acyl dehydratase